VLNSRVKIIGAIFVATIILIVGGVRVVHPHDGLSNALGSASSGISIYRTGTTFNVGAKVIFSTSPKSKFYLGIVRSYVKSNYQIQMGSKFYTAPENLVHGSLLAVVPFIGYPLGWIGL
jgi:hypothetical protein